MKTSSAKAKGRRLQDEVCGLIQVFLDLNRLDVRPAIMGESGRDVKLSELAESRFPFDVECKNTERLNVWSSWVQAKENTGKFRKPLLVFSKNRSETLCALRLGDLMDLLSRCKGV